MKNNSRTYLRFSLAHRIEHLIMLTLFSTLALTGLPQKFPETGIFISIVKIMGGIENTRNIHHIAATLLMLAMVYHLFIMGEKIFVYKLPLTLLPALQDLRDFRQTLLFNLGYTEVRPQMGRFTFEEKIEYWSFLWGTLIMAITGFMMWNPITTAKFLPGEFIPAAKIAHGYEAILAVLAIFIWHFYGVHLKFFNIAMWTGRISEKEMIIHHPLELEELKAPSKKSDVPPEILSKREKLYYPIATLISFALIFGIYKFITFEETAIITIKPQIENKP